MTIFGSDVSHFDAPNTVAMFDQGIVFQTHKAGGDANDTEIGNWWSYVRDQRPEVLLGAYWVLYPGDPVARADQFVARLDSQCPSWRAGPFILQADCENWNGNASTVPSVSEINAFCDRLRSRTGLVPVAYAPNWVYGSQVSALRYPLWSSSYVTGVGTPQHLYPGDGSGHWSSYGGKIPAILQYSSSATIGGQTTCDANAYRGTLAELIHLVAPEWSTMATLDSDDKAYLKSMFDAYLGFDANQADGTPTSRIGRLVWTQGLPDGTVAGTPRALAYQVLANLGLQVSAENVPNDPAAVASALITAGIGFDVAQALIQQLATPPAS